MNKPQLIIFDFDGVVVDSEYLLAQQQSTILTAAGHKITTEEFIQKFSGMRWETILKEVEKNSTLPISAKLIDIWNTVEQTFANDVELVSDFSKVIGEIKLPKAVASNGSMDYLTKIAKRLKLNKIFDDNFYSAPEHGTKKLKPEPDIYLFAAEQMNVKPANTIVIEDSVPGVKAAVAANMRVIGFTGGKHCYLGLSSLLMEAGAETTISSYKDLPAVIEAMNSWCP